MAENLDNQFGNFSIENTMEMGMGNSELLNDLMAPETASTNPDDIKEMTAEDKAPKAETSPKKAATKSIGETMEEAPEKKEETSIQDFLLGGDDEEEEEEEAPVKKTTSKQVEETNDSDDEESEPEVSQFGALANDLFKLGVFSKDDEEDDEPITTAEEFLEKFQAEKKKGAIEVVNNFIGQFGEDYQQAFDAIFVKGVDPKEYFGAYNQITSFADLDLSEERNQISVLKQALSDQGFDPEDVETEVERLKNYGDLETVATKHHKVLVKKEAAKLQQMEAQAERELQQKQAIKGQYIQNVQSVLQEKLKTKEFDGIPINPKLAGELQDFLLVDKYKTTSGETLTDFDRTILELKRPENHGMKVKVALLLKILEKDPTLSTIQKSGISKKSNELFGEVARQVTKSATKSSSSANKNSSWFL
ncbi:MAG: hypothetical protein EB127_03055 [Alphaproteobacteria bacterium]|nr:hypothetical protein [Alphaproteobacteria bacterium]